MNKFAKYVPEEDKKKQREFIGIDLNNMGGGTEVKREVVELTLTSQMAYADVYGWTIPGEGAPALRFVPFAMYERDEKGDLYGLAMIEGETYTLTLGDETLTLTCTHDEHGKFPAYFDETHSCFGLDFHTEKMYMTVFGRELPVGRNLEYSLSGKFEVCDMEIFNHEHSVEVEWYTDERRMTNTYMVDGARFSSEKALPLLLSNPRCRMIVKDINVGMNTRTYSYPFHVELQTDNDFIDSFTIRILSGANHGVMGMYNMELLSGRVTDLGGFEYEY